MKVNPYISSSMSAPLSGTENHVGNQAVKEDVKNLDQALLLLESDPSCNADLKTLSDTVNNQRSALSLMSSRNAEVDIANSLQNAIDDYAYDLDALQGWTTGGVKMFSSALKAMFESLISGGVDGIEREDIFQLALLEVMINPDDYGLRNWVEGTDNKKEISHLLESLGSGSHGLHEPGYDTPKDLARRAGDLAESLIRNATIPTGSFLDRIVNSLELNTDSGRQQLQDQIENNYHRGEGWLVYEKNPVSGTTAATSISPLLRMFLLSEVLEKNPDITQGDLNLILKGSVSEIEGFLKKTFNLSYSDDVLVKWLVDNTAWQIQKQDHNDTGGHGGQLDWTGPGLNIQDLVNLYSNFPPRVLSDEDIKEINRIGDTVKMIQQTLKYWIQIMRDERMAVARNI
ncbi:molecular chaperone [Vibrio parahaemolyticus]|nr:molecular chaperone [Vibrio parahaemolyticus]EJG1678012.1 molecular chaperone [Vibrio parahaemolyticus]EJG1718317.1 molecular chaperone [Vibrio parahaemolyticus]EJG1760306.1 molecular chaperone [Vibrio parahaemolyticus]ELB2016184.1 molecular chaperone [Vibrio parahaemolyticus]